MVAAAVVPELVEGKAGRKAAETANSPTAHSVRRHAQISIIDFWYSFS